MSKRSFRGNPHKLHLHYKTVSEDVTVVSLCKSGRPNLSCQAKGRKSSLRKSLLNSLVYSSQGSLTLHFQGNSFQEIKHFNQKNITDVVKAKTIQQKIIKSASENDNVTHRLQVAEIYSNLFLWDDNWRPKFKKEDFLNRTPKEISEVLDNSRSECLLIERYMKKYEYQQQKQSSSQKIPKGNK